MPTNLISVDSGALSHSFIHCRSLHFIGLTLHAREDGHGRTGTSWVGRGLEWFTVRVFYFVMSSNQQHRTETGRSSLGLKDCSNDDDLLNGRCANILGTDQEGDAANLRPDPYNAPHVDEPQVSGNDDRDRERWKKKSNASRVGRT